MKSSIRLAVVSLVGLSLLSCGEQKREVVGGGSCPKTTGGVPASKMIYPPSGAIPGQYIVVLISTVDVHASASELASKYSGAVLHEYAAPPGFSIAIADSQALLLAQEASVCWVAQDATVSAP